MTCYRFHTMLLGLNEIQDKAREEARNKIEKFDRQWKDFLSRGQVLNFKKGQVLFYEGHFPCGVFILLTGKVSILDKQGHEHKEISLPLYQTLGIDLLLTAQPYSFTAMCQSDTSALFLSKTILHEILDLSPLANDQ